MTARRLHTLLALGALAASSIGCSSTVRKPQLLSPGNAPIQRSVAEQFDPYPPNDLGPKIVGGRPPDYAVPRNEVERARQFDDARGGPQRLSTGGAPIPVAPPARLY